MLTGLSPWIVRNRIRTRLLMRRLRGSQFALIILSGLAGVLVGAAAYAMHAVVRLIHHAFFTIPLDSSLSDPFDIPRWRVLVFPVVGGVLVGVVSWFARRWRGRDAVDAVEANALYGGRMSLVDSCGLALATIISVGCGASVGMEAAYTQIGAAIFSKIGRFLNIRRSDLRTLVGCGAAAAIAAAFNAPLAGAFYAFELVIGSYNPAVFLPVAVASATSVLITQTLSLDAPAFPFVPVANLSGAVYLLFPLLGLLSGCLGIVVMQGVSLVEGRLRMHLVPIWIRPMLGGIVVAMIAGLFPQVLGSGHGAINTVMTWGLASLTMFGLIVAKIVASSISIGSGFRGGLFSASLMIGSLLGGACAFLLARAVPDLAEYNAVFILAGMAAVAATVVGAPLTMAFLVLEGTADFSTTIAVVISVIFASAVGQHLFGYSFATWRFHLRGLKISGAHDVGWMRDLTVDRVMRRDPRVGHSSQTLAEFAKHFPLGSIGSVFVVDPSARYLGSIDVVKVHEALSEGTNGNNEVGSLLSGEPHLLLSTTSIRASIDIFDASAQEELAVVDSGKERRIIGYLAESTALRRYSQELERRRAEEHGDSTIFAPDK